MFKVFHANFLVNLGSFFCSEPVPKFKFLNVITMTIVFISRSIECLRSTSLSFARILKAHAPRNNLKLLLQISIKIFGFILTLISPSCPCLRNISRVTSCEAPDNVSGSLMTLRKDGTDHLTMPCGESLGRIWTSATEDEESILAPRWGLKINIHSPHSDYIINYMRTNILITV